MLGDTRVYGARLFGQVRAQERVRKLDVRVDQLCLVPRLERVFDGLLTMAHAIGVEPQNLVD